MSRAHSTTLESLGADLISAVGGESDDELRAGLDEDFEVMKAAQGRVLLRLGECERRQAFRDDGATSVEAWVVQRYGVSVATARGLTQVGKVGSDLPHLVGVLVCGARTSRWTRCELWPTWPPPRPTRGLRDQARECSVRDLVEVARTSAAAAAAAAGRRGRQRRRSRGRARPALSALQRRAPHASAQLPPDSYAEVKAKIEVRAKDIDSDGETPWDQRLCDVLLRELGPVGVRPRVRRSQLIRPGRSSWSPTSPWPPWSRTQAKTSALAGELEHVGLIDIETVKRIACDATVAVAVDDDVGHTMYEGRARRFPTGAQRREVRRRDRQCRFPGCSDLTFAHVHHVVPWDPGGPTDVCNLVLLCEHHHGVVHRDGWTMTGNANEELIIVGPKAGS